MTFAMVVPRVPASINSKASASYREQLSQTARIRMGAKPLLEGPLYVRVNWFFNKPGGPDTDNIFKAILDALKLIVYRDDNQVVRCLACKFDLVKNSPQISDKNIPDEIIDVYDELITKLSTSYHSILYIEVGPILSQTARFGPIEETNL